MSLVMFKQYYIIFPGAAGPRQLAADVRAGSIVAGRIIHIAAQGRGWKIGFETKVY